LHAFFESLLAVLNDILLYSKADAGAIDLDNVPFNLNNMVEDVLQFVSSSVPADQEIDVTSLVRLDVPLFLMGDVSRLRQILLNLLSNAVKFTKFGEVSLEVSMVTEFPLVLKFSVNDTGIGISEADQRKLFTPFSQADATITRQYGGTGLGLAICKQLVKLFDGELSVQSMIGRGSTFCFTAKFAVDASVAKRSLVDALALNYDVTTLKGVRVLIIDDNATNCMAIEALLGQFGCRTQAAPTGQDGLDCARIAALKGEPFEVVLLDYHMPRMSGVEVARALAQRKLTPKIIVLANIVDGKVAQEPNILAVCSKPLRRGQLIQVVASVLTSPASVVKSKQFSDESHRRGGNEGCSLDGVCVLVAEDNNTNRDVLSLLLQQERCRVIEAVNGVDALDKMNDQAQVVLMDVHMPLLDGVSAAILLKKARPLIPIIFLTADVTAETEDKCNAAGAYAILNKPANKTAIVSTILAALGGAKKSPLTQHSISRCLVVDDNKTNLMFAGHLVRKVCGQDVIVVLADSGEAAIESVRKQCPDLILMDVKMPGMNGIEAARKIREMQLSQSLTIVAVTGLDDSATVRECRDVGMDSVLTKPLSEQHLHHLVASFGSTRSKLSSPNLGQGSIDVDDGSTCDLDADFRKQLLDDWRVSSMEQLHSMQDLLPRSEWKSLQDVAHSLKGSSAQLGAKTVSQLALKIERACRSGAPNVSEIRSALEELDKSLSFTFVHFGLCGNVQKI
jgi:CheY-like chemotaxis protein